MGEQVDALGELEGWQTEGYAARVHYEGGTENYSIEYYEPDATVLYWQVRDGGEVAVPVARQDVPEPLRRRIREDLESAGIDPAVESHSL